MKISSCGFRNFLRAGLAAVRLLLLNFPLEGRYSEIRFGGTENQLGDAGEFGLKRGGKKSRKGNCLLEVLHPGSPDPAQRNRFSLVREKQASSTLGSFYCRLGSQKAVAGGALLCSAILAGMEDGYGSQRDTEADDLS